MSIRRVICLALVLLAAASPASAEEVATAIRAYLQHRAKVEGKPGAIVVGLLDEHGSTMVAYGKGDDGEQEVNGDTVFEIGSISKTFTGLLLQDMVERGQMRLDDPVAKYLPDSVRVPSHGGKEITLVQLATHTSGLPTSSIIWTPKRADNPRAEYTIEKMYDFLSSYTLARDPGAKYEYSTAGIALLGHAIALKAGTDYESLVVDRICRPLGMDSTRIVLTPEMKARFVSGHNVFGYTVPASYWNALAPGAGLRSTANDLLKYVSAQFALTPSTLAAAMGKTHVAHFHAHMDTDIGLDTDLGVAWMITHDLTGAPIVQHSGLTDGFTAAICFDLTRRRGVVVLSSYQDFNVTPISKLLLESAWQADQRPAATRISIQALDSFVGQYRRSHAAFTASSPVIAVRREGDRLFARAIGSPSWPIDVLLPPFRVELLPESETQFFERLSGRPVTFSRDSAGKVTGLTVAYQSEAVSFEKTSDQPPPGPERPHPRVAIQLDTGLLDAVAGQYEFPSDATYPAGQKLTIWREGGQLVGQAKGKTALQGAFDIFPESETEFFVKLSGVTLTFVKNEKSEVTGVTQHSPRPGSPDNMGRKLQTRPE